MLTRNRTAVERSPVFGRVIGTSSSGMLAIMGSVRSGPIAARCHGHGNRTVCDEYGVRFSDDR